MNQSLDNSVVSNTQLNSSSAKMKYSFPKSSRFQNNRYKSNCPNVSYDLPDIKAKRTTTLGYGNKVQFGKQNFLVPGPESYKIKGDFQKKQKQGISMGLGRSEIKTNDFFGRDYKNPSPNAYNPQLLKRADSYSLYSRRPDMSDNWIKKVPGPGTYSALDITSKEKTPVSKYLSPASSRFGQVKRLSEAEMKNSKTPGPGNYKLENMSKKKFSEKNGAKFSRSQRKGLANFNSVPGPGQYQRVSDFSQ